MLVETDVFWEDEKDPNMTLKTVERYFPRVKAISGFIYPESLENQTFRGSLQLAAQLGRTFEYANVLNWLPHLRKWAVNDAYVFLDIGAIRQIFNESGVTSRGMFVRPVSPMKLFTGQVFTSVEKFEREFRLLTNDGKTGIETLCLVAEARPISIEYRFVIIKGELVGQSQYARNGEIQVTSSVPKQPREFARELAKQPYFDNIYEYVLDVGMVNGEPKLVEINAFETASFYGADLDAIYQAWHATFPEYE